MSRAPLVVHGSAAFPADHPGGVVTIGNFDGVHRGHRALLDRARGLAADRGGVVCAYTFDPAPRDVMAPDNGVPHIQSLDDKIASLGRAGADVVVVEPFTRDYAGHTAAFFAQTILGERLRCRGVVVGWDFRFGRGRAGDADTLRELLDVPVARVEAVAVDGVVVSSTEVRRRVSGGDVAVAARLLGRPHEVTGTVVAGDARGRELGFPTANVVPATDLVPPPGVYAVRVRLGEGRWHDAVANLGVRPTFGEARGRLEVHVLDWSGDLYGRTLRVGFVDRLRDERRFDGLDALVAQIDRDVAAARTVLAGVDGAGS